MTDKILHYGIGVFIVGWYGLFAVVTVCQFFVEITDEWWLSFWRGFVWVSVILAVITTVWFSVGGLVDMRNMFRALRAAKENINDDGRVPQEEHNRFAPKSTL